MEQLSNIPPAPETILVDGQEMSFKSVARALGRTRIVGREANGNIVSAEGQAIELRMQENAQRAARERASQDGLEMPPVFQA